MLHGLSVDSLYREVKEKGSQDCSLSFSLICFWFVIHRKTNLFTEMVVYNIIVITAVITTGRITPKLNSHPVLVS